MKAVPVSPGCRIKVADLTFFVDRTVACTDKAGRGGSSSRANEGQSSENDSRCCLAFHDVSLRFRPWLRNRRPGPP
jgi:hypothetical protein